MSPVPEKVTLRVVGLALSATGTQEPILLLVEYSTLSILLRQFSVTVAVKVCVKVQLASTVSFTSTTTTTGAVSSVIVTVCSSIVLSLSSSSVAFHLIVWLPTPKVILAV